MTIKELQQLGCRRLAQSVFNPEFESDLLLAFLLKKDRVFLYAHPNKKIFNFQFSIFKELLQRRRKGEPFAYLVGQTQFYNLTLKVSRDVLIPRPETELLVDEALKLLRDTRYAIHDVIDVGTGSGAIIIAIAKKINPRGRIQGSIRGLELIATDISGKALKVTRLNARKNLGKNHPIKFIKSNLLTFGIEHRNGKLTRIRPRLKQPLLVIANLPYLTPQELRRRELSFEPQKALLGGKGGLILIEKLIKQFAQIAAAGDILALEIGAKQGETIKKITKKYMPQSRLSLKTDYSGFDRIFTIRAK